MAAAGARRGVALKVSDAWVHTCMESHVDLRCASLMPTANVDVVLARRAERRGAFRVVTTQQDGPGAVRKRAQRSF
eukprot:365226-Chlamydomonas_euryale.AAC.2